MRNVLIVEDEKLIRQGIKVMIQRSTISVGEILESKNGEEALNILQREKIDLMITDIRMPRMDGIQLVKRIQQLEYRPKVVVVSGYEDFHYAVESLRLGVKEYLLKPIERGELTRILESIDIEIEKEKEQGHVKKQIGMQQIKYVILNKEIGSEEVLSIEQQFEDDFFKEGYVVGVSSTFDIPKWENIKLLVLREVEGQVVFIIDQKEFKNCLDNGLEKYVIGFSGEYKGISQLRTAYSEALLARKTAFVKGKSCYFFQIHQKVEGDVPKETIEHFVQIFGTGKIDFALKKISNLHFEAKTEKLSCEDFLNVMKHIIGKLTESYNQLWIKEEGEFEKIKMPLEYQDFDHYFVAFSNWSKAMAQKIDAQFHDYKNKEKIARALRFIQENYHKNLNMAVVSNYISMNYSLFSLSFKEYTGMNFVNYLKKLRIEQAKRLLEETEDKIMEISQAVGYENEKHFMKTFKSICGVSPTEYRKNKDLSSDIHYE